MENVGRQLEDLKDTYHWLLLSVGRIDEVLIHSSGEKTVPMPIENVVMTSPL